MGTMPSRATLWAVRATPFSFPEAISLSFASLELVAILVVPSIRALIPVPEPLPDTYTLTEGFFFIKTSAAFWAIGKTVVEPSILRSSAHESPVRDEIKKTESKTVENFRIITSSFLDFKILSDCYSYVTFLLQFCYISHLPLIDASFRQPGQSILA